MPIVNIVKFSVRGPNFAGIVPVSLQPFMIEKTIQSVSMCSFGISYLKLLGKESVVVTLLFWLCSGHFK